MNEFGRFGGPKRHNSLDGLKRNRYGVVRRYQDTQSQYVSETEEDLYSDESDKKKRKKSKVSQFSTFLHKKVYSDEFEKSFESQFKKRFRMDSVIDSPIREDVESEDQQSELPLNYLSDGSSNSTFTFHKKRMSFDLTRIIDRLEPGSNGINVKNYGLAVTETI